MISAIVLAAGKSSRMGTENKMLLPFKESTIIGTVLEQLKQSNVDEIIVVTGQDKDFNNSLGGDKKLRIVVNKRADDGLTSSIQCGIRATSDHSTAYLICLGDMPFLTKIDYNLLISRLIALNNKVILMPMFNNKRGNPVLFSHHFKEDILKLQKKSGCKPIVLANINLVIEVPFPNNNCHIDIDTMEDYKNLVS